MSDAPMIRISTWLPASIVARLDRVAERNSVRGWKRANVIREALADYLAKEDPEASQPQELQKWEILKERGLVHDLVFAGGLASEEDLDPRDLDPPDPGADPADRDDGEGV